MSEPELFNQNISMVAIRIILTLITSAFILTEGYSQLEVDSTVLDKFLNSAKVKSWFHAGVKVSDSLVMLDPLDRFHGYFPVLSWNEKRLYLRMDTSLLRGPRFLEAIPGPRLNSIVYVLRDYFYMRGEYFITIVNPLSGQGASGKIVLKGKRLILKYVDLFVE